MVFGVKITEKCVKSGLVRIRTKANFHTEPHGQLEANDAEPKGWAYLT